MLNLISDEKCICNIIANNTNTTSVIKPFNTTSEINLIPINEKTQTTSNKNQFHESVLKIADIADTIYNVVYVASKAINLIINTHKMINANHIFDGIPLALEVIGVHHQVVQEE